MKLNELKKPQEPVNEGFWDTLIGDKNVAKFKSIGTGRTTQQQLTMDIFIRDFMGDALTALKTGIKGGLIDPKAKTNSVANANAAGEPAAPSNRAAQSAEKFNKQKQSTRDVNQYLQNLDKSYKSASTFQEKINLTKELINFMADRKGTPEWNNALGTVKAMLTRNLSKDNLAVALDLINKGKHIKVDTAESKYAKLNALFESILNEADSVGSYMQKWFAQYMRGVDYSEYNNEVNNLIKNIEQSYPKVKPNLKKLAQMAYAISKGKSSSQVEPEAQPEQPEQPEQSAQSARKPNSRELQRQLDKELTQLARTDQRAYNELLARRTKSNAQ